jgi:hypothetical protein
MAIATNRMRIAGSGDLFGASGIGQCLFNLGQLLSVAGQATQGILDVLEA